MSESATLVPDNTTDGIVHMVFDDLGPAGCVWRELDNTDTSNIAKQIIDGAFQRPVKIVVVDRSRQWVWDLTEDVARMLIEMARKRGLVLRQTAAEFITRATKTAVPAELLEAHPT